MERDELAKKAAYLRDYFGKSGGKWSFMVSEVLERKCMESLSYRLSRFAIFFNTSKANIFIFKNKVQIVYKCIFSYISSRNTIDMSLEWRWQYSTLYS